jgi:hypothetical protein
MNKAEIREKADRTLKELEQDINTYHPIVWGIPWEVDSIERIQAIITFYLGRKGQWLKMLAGAGEIARRTLLEFMSLADLEIGAAEGILSMIQGGLDEPRTGAFDAG